ncbi:MAG: helix-turn-helix domain-containing protein [SAR202 cluster bacterium]|nr:helix-turn-helix domain-containing protein [SAR202 cluster bacterium]
MEGGQMVSSDLMTTKELSEYLQLDRMTIYKLLKSGDIPANRVGHQWRFFRSDIDDWIRSKQVRPGSPERLSE